jgi:DNA-binding response OmpR family regulator
MTHILVIDDEPLIAVAWRENLIESGYRVSMAHNGASALAICKRDPPDIVVTDLKMPKMGGLAFLQALRRQWTDVPVVVVSGYLDEARSLPPDSRIELLAKPLDARILVDRVSRLAARDHAQDTRPGGSTPTD